MAHFRKGKTAGSATTDSCRCEKIQKNLEVAQNKLKKTFAKLDKLKKAAVKKVAKKVATLPLKAVPILGWAMAAYDVYDVVTTGIDIAEVVEQFNKEAAIVNKLHKKLDACLGKKHKKLPKKVTCFKPGDGLEKGFKKRYPKGTTNEGRTLEEEFNRQLKNQEDGINKMSPDDLIEGIDNYKGMRDPKKSKEIREAYKDKIKEIREDELKNSGFSRTKIKKLSEEYAENAAKQVAALHNPDGIAGGKDAFKVENLDKHIGDKGVNSSLGSQWAKEDRTKALRAQAVEAKANGDKKMNTKLKRCK
jgi:hypothetical protein